MLVINAVRLRRFFKRYRNVDAGLIWRLLSGVLL